MFWQNRNGLDFGSKLQGLFLSLAQAVLSAELTALLERRKALKREQKEAAKEQKNLSRKKQRLLKARVSFTICLLPSACWSLVGVSAFSSQAARGLSSEDLSQLLRAKQRTDADERMGVAANGMDGNGGNVEVEG